MPHMNPDDAARALGFPALGPVPNDPEAVDVSFDFELSEDDVRDITPPSSFGSIRKPALLNMPQENF